MLAQQIHRYKLTLEYDGSDFSGWQSQQDRRGVQDTLVDALGRMGAIPLAVVGAGRTDTGVHALAQVAHCDLHRPLDPHKLMTGINHFAKPKRLAVLAAEEVDLDFHARFSAQQRHYIYRMVLRKAPLIIDAQRAWLVRDELCLEKMQAATTLFIGRHNFTNFRLKRCQAASPIKTIDAMIISSQSQNGLNELKTTESSLQREVLFSIKARSFLHRQVRIMVGAIYDVGRGHLTLADLTTALNPEEDCLSTFAPHFSCSHAPPWGLYLAGVRY